MGDYAYNLANKAISIIGGLVVSVILARYLGVAARGEFGFIQQTGSLVAVVAGLGVNQSFIRYFKLSPTPRFLSRVLSVLILQIIGFLFIAVALSIVTEDRTVQFIAAIAVATAGYQQIEAIMAAYDIRLKMRVNIVYSILRVAAHLGLWLLGDGEVFGPVMIVIALGLVASITYVCLVERPRLQWPSLAVMKTLYGFGWLPMLTTLLIVLNYNVDIVMLKVLGEAKDLGMYAVAAGVVTYLWVIPDAIKEVLLSRIVRSNDIARVLLPMKVALGASVACVVAIISVGWFLVPLMYGEEFKDSYVLIVILSLGVCPMVFYKILGSVLLAEGKRWFYFTSLLVAVILNIGVNSVVIGPYGPTGAAWASVVTYVFTGISFLSYYRRLGNFSWRSMLVPTASEYWAIVNGVRKWIKR